MKFLTKDSLNIESRPKIISTEAFHPKIDDYSQIRVIWEELSDSRCDLKLIARGKFLLPHMSSGENVFTGSPFTKASAYDIVSICRKFCILFEGESVQGVFQLSIHSTPFFELSLVLLTTKALGLYEFTKKFQRYRPKIEVQGKIFVFALFTREKCPK